MKGLGLWVEKVTAGGGKYGCSQVSDGVQDPGLQVIEEQALINPQRRRVGLPRPPLNTKSHLVPAAPGREGARRVLLPIPSLAGLVLRAMGRGEAQAQMRP